MFSGNHCRLQREYAIQRQTVVAALLSTLTVAMSGHEINQFTPHVKTRSLNQLNAREYTIGQIYIVISNNSPPRENNGYFSRPLTPENTSQTIATIKPADFP